MIRIPILLMSLMLVLSSLSQHIVKDQETHEPIPYALIKVLKNSKGVIADFNGSFQLEDDIQLEDTLEISCIGYEVIELTRKKLEEGNEVFLKLKHRELSEIIVKVDKKKFKTKNLGVKKIPKKNYLNTGVVGSGKNGEQNAIWIPNEYSVSGYLKKVHVYVTDKGYPDAHFRLHVYDCGVVRVKPGKELTSSNLVVAGSKGNEWLSVDVSKEYIKIGPNGCFIGIEWFESPKSKVYSDTMSTDVKMYQEGKFVKTEVNNVLTGTGAVIGDVHFKYSLAKNRMWANSDRGWLYKDQTIEDRMYVNDTINGFVYALTPDKVRLPLLSINIDVVFPKAKIEQMYTQESKRKLNRIEKTKKDLNKYPQTNIYELLHSLMKSFENHDYIYAFKYLFVYPEDELEELLDYTYKEKKCLITEKQKDDIIKWFQELNRIISQENLIKINDRCYKFQDGIDVLYFTVDKGEWRWNPFERPKLKNALMSN